MTDLEFFAAWLGMALPLASCPQLCAFPVTLAIVIALHWLNDK